MQSFALAQKVSISPKSRVYRFLDLQILLLFHSTYKQRQRHPSSSSIRYPQSHFTLTEIIWLASAHDRKGVTGRKIPAMFTPVSAVSACHSLPWKCPGPKNGDLPSGKWTRGVSGFPHRDGSCFVRTPLRGGQFCRLSSSAAEPSSEVGHTDQKSDFKTVKPTIYDSLEMKRITVELFPELDFPLSGNFYPKLVPVIARKVNTLLEEVGGEDRVPGFLKHVGLKLNPHIVAEVLKQQTNPSKSERFFEWAGNQPDFQHNAHTYNHHFWNLLNKNDDVPGSLVLALILLEDMIAKNLNPGPVACNVLVDRLCKDNKVGAALKLVKVLERKGFPDVVTYNSLINGLGKSGLFKEVFELLEEMKQSGCIPDIVTYNSLISGLSKAGLFKDVFELLDEMTQKGCPPDRMTYNSIIHGLGYAGRWQEARKIFDEFPQKELVPDVVTYNSLMAGLFQCGQVDEACKVFDLMGLRDCKPDLITYNTLIGGLLKSGLVEEAWKIFRFLKEGFTPDEVTYNIMVAGLVNDDRLTEASTLFTTMKEKGFKANAVTCRMLGLSGQLEECGGLKYSTGVLERDQSFESGNDSGRSGFGKLNEQTMEGEMQVLHS